MEFAGTVKVSEMDGILTIIPIDFPGTVNVLISYYQIGIARNSKQLVKVHRLLGVVRVVHGPLSATVMSLLEGLIASVHRELTATENVICPPSREMLTIVQRALSATVGL